MLDAQTFSLGLYLVSNSISIRHRVRVDTVALRALPKMCLSCVVGRCVYTATSCRARARVSAVAAPCASAHRGSV